MGWLVRRRNQGEGCDDCPKELGLEFALQSALVPLLSSHQQQAAELETALIPALEMKIRRALVNERNVMTNFYLAE